VQRRIIYLQLDYVTGELTPRVILPNPKAWKDTVKSVTECAERDVPFLIESFTLENGKPVPVYSDEKCEYKIVTDSDLPVSRNWRDAWTLDENLTEIDVSLEKAKPIHRQLIQTKALERLPMDGFGRQDLTQVESELEALDIDGAASLTELYNMWPESIDLRSDDREYVVR